MYNTVPFDTMAADYDRTFTSSTTGRMQREMVRKWLMPYLKGKQALDILEINCGTGEDALWLSSLGHQVHATDASAEMIRIAANKKTTGIPNAPSFSACSFENLHSEFGHRKFDMVFSNFAGLNCLDIDAARSLLEEMYTLLRPGGKMALVIFGKYCLVEILYYLVKLQPRKAARRWKDAAVPVLLSEGLHQHVHYYSVKKLVKDLPFELIEQRPVGLLVPPSYLEAAVAKHPSLGKGLFNTEKHLGFRWAASLADHSFILLKKP